MMRSIFLLFSLTNGLAQAAFEVPGFELVVTTPVETQLANDDLRDSVTVWKELIDGAKKRIDFGHMYASGKEGEPLDAVIERLEAAGARGVKIRFLLEEKMQRASVPETVERLKKITGLELRIMAFGKVKGDGIIHSKQMTIDGGEKAFVGSQNFDWRALKHIHETGLLITDRKIAKQIQAIFDFDWKAHELLAKGRKVPVLNRKIVDANLKERAILLASPNAYNPKGVADSQSTLPRLIGEAKEEIRIQLLDYYPLARDKSFYPLIDNALRAAQARKVKIKLLVSHWNTSAPGIDHLKSLSLLPGVEIKITTIPLGKEGAIPFARVNHSKVMTIDKQLSWVGTSNWTGGYLDNSRNLEVVVRDEKLTARLTALHEQLWASPYSAPVDVQKVYPKPTKGE
jgi:phosphatidylserine/phosphatidylglycerophosphate/cardiolipin synthase-like enzyme